LEIARELTRTRAGDPCAWLRLAAALGDARLDEERLEAIDRAISLAPRNLEAWDTRAVLFSEQGRFEEALQACAPAAFAPHAPVPLCARSAWVHAQSGDRKRAITEMEKVVESAPDHYWSWLCLTEWHTDEKNYSAALAAAERAAGLSPTSPVPLAHIADLH